MPERSEDLDIEEEGAVEDAEDEAGEFDEESDEEIEDSTVVQGELGNAATFLLGTRTRFGRVVRFNNRLLLRSFIMKFIIISVFI